MAPTALLSLLAGSTFPVRALPRFLLPLPLALALTYGHDAVRGYLLHPAHADAAAHGR